MFVLSIFTHLLIYAIARVKRSSHKRCCCRPCTGYHNQYPECKGYSNDEARNKCEGEAPNESKDGAPNESKYEAPNASQIIETTNNIEEKHAQQENQPIEENTPISLDISKGGTIIIKPNDLKTDPKRSVLNIKPAFIRPSDRDKSVLNDTSQGAIPNGNLLNINTTKQSALQNVHNMNSSNASIYQNQPTEVLSNTEKNEPKFSTNVGRTLPLLITDEQLQPRLLMNQPDSLASINISSEALPKQGVYNDNSNPANLDDQSYPVYSQAKGQVSYISVARN